MISPAAFFSFVVSGLPLITEFNISFISDFSFVVSINSLELSALAGIAVDDEDDDRIAGGLVSAEFVLEEFDEELVFLQEYVASEIMTIEIINNCFMIFNCLKETV